MEAYREPWALVLAAGEGSRLRALTVDGKGNTIPKQFCSLNGGVPLLRLALDRAARVASAERITTIVAAQHARWWRDELAEVPDRNIFVQPRNRGTAIGVLMPLLRIVTRDPAARIVLLPSDHYVADETILAEAVREMLVEVDRRPDRVVLLGIVPDEPDSEFGWVVPASHGEPGVRPVERFVEKPPAPVASELMRGGGMWNSFIVAASGSTLLEMFEERAPGALAALARATPVGDGPGSRERRLADAYDSLSSLDFCRDVLEGFESRLSVLPVGDCGWSDLGTPERVARCVAGIADVTCPSEPVTVTGEIAVPVLAQAARLRA